MGSGVVGGAAGLIGGNGTVAGCYTLDAAAADGADTGGGGCERHRQAGCGGSGKSAAATDSNGRCGAKGDCLAALGKRGTGADAEQQYKRC